MENQVSHSIATFAAKFCNELGTNKTSICSPLSAEIVLALLALGCKNQSQAELLKALDMTDDEIRSSFFFLKSKLQSIQGTTLNVANRVYLQLGSELKPGVKKDAEEVFESSLEQLDFKESVAAAGAINKWVAEKTDDKITNIVSPDMLNNETRVVLVNAMYFKAKKTNDKDGGVNLPSSIDPYELAYDKL
ncbi:hypothetical protein MSG28_008900 [Choristoneura fumiferana]|uniref:Uncharacterized protein n=1 Tax=Choristoneura fumiferana TaxID=7141 RepID=A0ACC0J8G2_CHOFU|nr:hypothetical protein MSG28_008900 [Choristoneura fumiferana]